MFTVCYSSLSVNQLFWTRLQWKDKPSLHGDENRQMSETEDPLGVHSLRRMKLLRITTQCEDKGLTERMKLFRKSQKKLALVHKETGTYELTAPFHYISRSKQLKWRLSLIQYYVFTWTKPNSVAWVRERTIPTESAKLATTFEVATCSTWRIPTAVLSDF
jgi:hypothetical protein